MLRNKKNFLKTWVHPEIKGIEKDSLKKYLACTPSKEAIDLSQSEKLGAAKYQTKIVEEILIVRGLKWMCTDSIIHQL